MSSPTHATVATFDMDLRREAEQRAGLDQMIVPGVRSAPGVISGHWTVDREAGESVVLITYDSLEAAEAMARSVKANAENQARVGLTLLGVRVVEVVATT